MKAIKKEELDKKIEDGEMGFFIWGYIKQEGNKVYLKADYDQIEDLLKRGWLREGAFYKIIFKKAIHECPVMRSETEETN